MPNKLQAREAADSTSGSSSTIPGAYAPGFTPASASRTQSRYLIRQGCDYPKEPLAKI